jgi:hypothetical protein
MEMHRWYFLCKFFRYDQDNGAALRGFEGGNFMVPAPVAVDSTATAIQGMQIWECRCR